MVQLFENQSSFSLYVHVPFCVVKCSYCDFYSKKSRSGVTLYLKALSEEVRILLEKYPPLAMLPVETVFIGGGTPSILTVDEWKSFAKILQRFNLVDLIEWTVECNPESFTVEKAEAYLESGVNRLSFGVQSLNDDELTLIGRAHKAKRVEAILQEPILKSFKRGISCDLIYGLPSQNLDSLRNSIQRLTSFEILQHISAYELTIADGTPLAERIDEFSLPTEEEMVEIVHLCRDELEKAGFSRYEISNYAKEGYESLHNSAYWKRSPYLGLGPAAHSFDGMYRFANPASLDHYSIAVQENSLAHESYTICSQEDALEEFLFLSLRMNRGFHEGDFERLFGTPFYNEKRRKSIDELVTEGVLNHKEQRWFCTERGLDIVDAVALRLLEQ